MGFLDETGLKFLWEKIKSEISGGRADGSPVGTVISFMGKTAPSGYLIGAGTAL